MGGGEWKIGEEELENGKGELRMGRGGGLEGGKKGDREKVDDKVGNGDWEDVEWE